MQSRFKSEQQTQVVEKPIPTCDVCDSPIDTVFTECSKMVFLPYVDYKGVTHEHDKNTHHAQVRCLRGHVKLILIDPPECPAKCGFGTQMGTILHQMSSGAITT